MRCKPAASTSSTNGSHQATAEGRSWVTMADTKLLDTIRDTGLLRVGDGLSCIYTVTSSLELVRSAKLTMDGIRVYAAKAWGAEYGGYGAHVWRNCYFGPRPGTSQWQGGEGFMFNATRHGTTLDGVVIRHTTDDIANFHGYWGHIESLAGNRVTFKGSGEFDRTVLRDAAAGDRLLFRDRNTGQPLGEARVAGTEGHVVIADRPVADFTNAIVEWPDHACAGWRVLRCDFQDNYQRLLIQSGPGTVSNCLFAPGRRHRDQQRLPLRRGRRGARHHDHGQHVCRGESAAGRRGGIDAHAYL